MRGKVPAAAVRTAVDREAGSTILLAPDQIFLGFLPGRIAVFGGTGFTLARFGLRFAGYGMPLSLAGKRIIKRAERTKARREFCLLSSPSRALLAAHNVSFGHVASLPERYPNRHAP